MMPTPTPDLRAAIADYLEHYEFQMPLMNDSLPFAEVERVFRFTLDSIAQFIREGDATPLFVHKVICIEPDGSDTTHIFSSAEKARAFAAADPRPHVLSDYLVDHPERHEGQAQ